MYCVFRILGVPDLEKWTDYVTYPEADPSYWIKDTVPLGLDVAVPSLDEEGLDLLSVIPPFTVTDYLVLMSNTIEISQICPRGENFCR